MSVGRRYLATVILAALLVPLLGLVAAPYVTQSAPERRLLAPPPSIPRDGAAWIMAPRRIDAWFADHFAWRGPLVSAALTVDTQVGLKPRGGLEVVRGRGDWLLLYSGLLALTGGEVRPEAAEAYARFACNLAAESRGHAAFLLAPAPGPAEIYPEILPDWVPRGSPTQTDLLLQAAGRCGLQPLDLRPALRAAKSAGPLYQRHDSHWTDLGATVAFNGVAQRLAQPWRIDPAAQAWDWETKIDSDLARLSGNLNLAPERIARLSTPAGFGLGPGRLGDLDHGIYKPAFETRPPGAAVTVLIVGDSYTSDYMAPLFWRAGVALAWIHQGDCAFDHRVFDRIKPDIVLLMPSTRLAACR